MMIMMSSITKVFNKSAKRNFHQRESQQEDKIATIYYDIEEKEGNEEMTSQGTILLGHFTNLVHFEPFFV